MEDEVLRDDDSQSRQTNRSAFTFTLPTLFYLTAVYGISCYYGIEIVLLTTSILLVWWFWLLPSGQRGLAKFLALTFAISLFLVSALLPSIQSTRGQHSGPTRCLNTIRQLALGMFGYQQKHRHFPAAYLVSETGKPMHSWRVLLLPHIEYENLYNTYDFDEPWDGPNNIKLLDQMPPLFQCPHNADGAKRGPAGTTTYKLVTGPGTAFHGVNTVGFADISDGSFNTMMIVEDFANPVPWTKPDDLTIDEVVEIFRRSNQCCAHEIDHHFTKEIRGNSVCLFDGSTHQLGPSNKLEEIRRLCTIADGHKVSFNDQEADSLVIYKVEPFTVFTVYLAILLIPGWILRRQLNGRSSSKAART